jgi:hypothetical protein
MVGAGDTRIRSQTHRNPSYLRASHTRGDAPLLPHMTNFTLFNAMKAAGVRLLGAFLLGVRDDEVLHESALAAPSESVTVAVGVASADPLRGFVLLEFFQPAGVRLSKVGDVGLWSCPGTCAKARHPLAPIVSCNSLPNSLAADPGVLSRIRACSLTHQLFAAYTSSPFFFARSEASLSANPRSIISKSRSVRGSSC